MNLISNLPEIRIILYFILKHDSYSPTDYWFFMPAYAHHAARLAIQILSASLKPRAMPRLTNSLENGHKNHDTKMHRTHKYSSARIYFRARPLKSF